jgi:hypothetical protein
MVKTLIRWLGSWLFAVLITAILATIAQTQVVIAMLPQTGPPVGLSERLSTTAYDLQYLGTTLFGFVAVALLVAFLVSEFVARFVPLRLRKIVLLVAGAVAIFVMLKTMKANFFDTDIIAGARNWIGYSLLMLSGAIGGLIFARLTKRRRRSRYAID